jgi:hypothetical protein
LSGRPADELWWRHVAACGWLALTQAMTQALTQAMTQALTQGPWTGAVDPVHRSTVDRSRGYAPFLIWPSKPDRAAGGAMAWAAALQGAARDGGRRRARRKIAGDGQKDFPCTKIHGKRTKMKRTWGTYREAWKGGRGTDGIDRAAELRRRSALRRRRRCTSGERRRSGAGCRGGLGAPFIGKRGGGRPGRRWEWELAGRPLMAAAGGSVQPLQGEEGAGTAVGECGGSIYGAVEEADGRGAAGNSRRRGRPVAGVGMGSGWR